MMFALPAILDQQGIQDLVNPRYCPQDITGFYTIDANITPQQDLVNYCEQNTTGFYDFAQAP
jgi:hypothetical protein